MDKSFLLRKRDERGVVASLAFFGLTGDVVLRELLLRDAKRLSDAYILPVYQESQWYAAVLLSQLCRPLDQPPENEEGHVQLQNPEEILSRLNVWTLNRGGWLLLNLQLERQQYKQKQKQKNSSTTTSITTAPKTKSPAVVSSESRPPSRPASPPPPLPPSPPLPPPSGLPPPSSNSPPPLPPPEDSPMAGPNGDVNAQSPPLPSSGPTIASPPPPPLVYNALPVPSDTGGSGSSIKDLVDPVAPPVPPPPVELEMEKELDFGEAKDASESLAHLVIKRLMRSTRSSAATPLTVAARSPLPMTSPIPCSVASPDLIPATPDTGYS